MKGGKISCPVVQCINDSKVDDNTKSWSLESFDSLCELPCGLRIGEQGWDRG